MRMWARTSRGYSATFRYLGFPTSSTPLTHCKRHLSLSSPSPPDEHRNVVERWRAFFSDPSRWWDHRSEKTNSRYPDFTHKTTHEPLWLNGKKNPMWVKAELKTLVSGPAQKNLFSWNALLAKHIKRADRHKTLELFRKLQDEGLSPDRYSYVPALKACAGLGVEALDEGRRLHSSVIQSGFESDPFVRSSLVDMYAKCGSIDEAWQVFAAAEFRDVVIWTAMIKGFVNFRQAFRALDLFQQMQIQRVNPNSFTFAAALNACALVRDINKTRCIHEKIICGGFQSDPYVSSTLIDTYAKCGCIEDAEKIFRELPRTDIVIWNAMIVGYAKCGQGKQALELYQQMEATTGLEPNSISFKGVFNACAIERALEDGRRIHSQIIRLGLESEEHLASSLVDMYAKCGKVDDPLIVFSKMTSQDSVSWNAIIFGLAKAGQGQRALELSKLMEQRGMKPNSATFVSLVQYCADASLLDEGKHLHGRIVKCGLHWENIIASSLVDMYVKCECMKDAWTIFNKMPIQDVVLWTSMIKGYVKRGRGKNALEVFNRMQKSGVEPDRITFVAVLNACAYAVALHEGRKVHEQIINLGCQSDMFLGNALVDMYAKCGSIKEAQAAFENMPNRDVVSWNSMLRGHAMHGHAKLVLRLFEQMQQESIEPDSVTLVCLLSACSHAGLVNEGLHLFQSMDRLYGVSPTAAHYACLVDLLCRAGQLQEAAEMVTTMPCNSDVSVWKALLGACRVHGNVRLGEDIAKQVLEMDPQNSSGYALLSNIYAVAGNWDGRKAVEELRKERRVRKQPGCTWIALNGEVHSFTVGDTSHPRSKEIHAELSRLTLKMKEAGYVPDTGFALHDVDDEEKIEHLSHHSEKLAIAFGLISTPPKDPIWIYKNLRVCGDCHSATKLISKIEAREIVVRDLNRFHHFENGSCSCGDYW